jgi:hypothetical protein
MYLRDGDGDGLASPLLSGSEEATPCTVYQKETSVMARVKAKKKKAAKECVKKRRWEKFNQFFTLEKGFKIGPFGIFGPSPLAYWPQDGTSNPRRPYFETLLPYKMNIIHVF